MRVWLAMIVLGMGLSLSPSFGAAPSQPGAGAPPRAGPVALAHRPFRMGFTPFPDDISLQAIADNHRYFQEAADLVSMHFEGVPWAEAAAGQPFHSKIMDDWKRFKSLAGGGKKVYLAISPLNNGRSDIAGQRADQENLPLPPGLAGKRLDDPAVMAAYLAYCRRAVEYFGPDYLAIGIEVNELFHNGRPRWDAYVALHQHVYQALKKDHPALPVFASFTLHNTINPAWRDRAEMLAAFKKLMPWNDVVAISFYPFMVQPMTDPARTLDWVAGEFEPFGKPFAFAECGQPAETLTLTTPKLTIPADPAGQRQALAVLLDFAHRRKCLFVTWFLARDYDGMWEKLRPTAPEFFKVWKDCGLWDGAGQPRPAHALWMEHFRLPVR